MSNRLQGKATILSAEPKKFKDRETGREVSYISCKVLIGDDTFTMTSRASIEDIEPVLREEALVEFSVSKKVSEKAEFIKLTIEAILQ